MQELEKIRQELNEIDDELVRLFERRLGLIDEVAAAKMRSGMPIFDPGRERAILTRVAAAVGPEMEIPSKVLFSTLFNISRARQRKTIGDISPLGNEIMNAIANTPKQFPSQATVACPGAEGSYSQQAADQLIKFPTIFYFNSFEDVCSAVEKGMCRYGILPIENSAAGSVTAVYDLMLRHRFNIVRALRQQVRHVLLAPRGVKLQDVKTVHSHPQALAQCSEFLQSNPQMTACPSGNTAVAARDIAASGRKDAAVIASRACAELYGLQVLSEDICNTSANYTRFICISKDCEIYPDTRKFSFMMTLAHRPGALYGVMAKFAALDLNLTKLESRPIPGRDFEFRFAFDFEAPASDERVVGLISELASDPGIEQFTFLGAYAEC